jgi:hypothetical protein
LNARVGIQAYLYFISHAVYINKHDCGRLLHKIAFNKCNHGRENKKTNVKYQCDECDEYGNVKIS